MVRRRDIVTAIILSIVTCGIYGIYWMVCLNDEVNTLSGNTSDPSGGTVFLLTIVTCGIYSLYWMYRTGEKLDSIAASRGQAQSSRGILYLVLSLFGLGIVSYCLMQDSINKFVA